MCWGQGHRRLLSEEYKANRFHCIVMTGSVGSFLTMLGGCIEHKGDNHSSADATDVGQEVFFRPSSIASSVISQEMTYQVEADSILQV